ncbi:hypothetical protein C8J57DRAFT_1479250, partial [Mycena rebaudengoi]
MDTILENPQLALNSLSDSFKESRARIAELEQEVDQLSRAEKDLIGSVELANSTIKTLEQDNGLLRELVAHQDTSQAKMKKEEEPEVRLQDTAAPSGPDPSLN